MNWRPEGWENPHVDALAKATGHPDSIYEPIFEAGADAMYQPAHDKAYAEGQAERDMLRKALRLLAVDAFCSGCHSKGTSACRKCDEPSEEYILQEVLRAISEAGKEVGG